MDDSDEELSSEDHRRLQNRLSSQRLRDRVKRNARNMKEEIEGLRKRVLELEIELAKYKAFIDVREMDKVLETAHC